MRTVLRSLVALLAVVFVLGALPAPADAAAATPSSVNFGPVAVNTTKAKSVRITVDAGYRISAADSGADAPFQLDLAACGKPTGGFKGPGNCQARAQLVPTAAGAVSGVITVAQCPIAGGACIPVEINAQGSGFFTFATAKPSPLDFGAFTGSTPVYKNIALTVDRGYEIRFADGDAQDAPFHFEFGSCQNRPRGPKCAVQLSFRPLQPGSFTRTINVYECIIGIGSVPITDPRCVKVSVVVKGSRS